jgi:hypothetical protein
MSTKVGLSHDTTHSALSRETGHDIVSMFNREADRINLEMSQCLKDGYQVWHWYDGDILTTDRIRTFGFVTLVKRSQEPYT